MNDFLFCSEDFVRGGFSFRRDDRVYDKCVRRGLLHKRQFGIFALLTEGQ